MDETHISCPRCGARNTRFAAECSECGNYLRDKVANIDLFETLSGLADEPGRTFDRIIFAENKNFTSFFFTFGVLKFFFLGYLISYHFLALEPDGILLIYGRFMLSIFLTLLIPYLVYLMIPSLRRELLWRDIIAAISYAMAPVALSALIMIFLEFIIYGEFLFNHSPSPLDFKHFFGVLFLILELGFLLWTVFLFAMLFTRLTGRKVYSATIALLITGILIIVNLAVINLLSSSNLGIK